MFTYIAIGFGVLVLLFVVLVIVMRIINARAEARLREDIREYVTVNGGTVTFDEADGLIIDGPLGRGRESMFALRIRLRNSRDRKFAMGLALRKYIPDEFYAAMEKTIAKQLVDAQERSLSCFQRSCVIGYGSRSFVRAGSRLVSHRAHGRSSLTSRLGWSSMDSSSMHFRPTRVRVFRRARVVIAAGCGTKLAWIVGQEGIGASDLAALASRSRADGSLKGVLVAWDGNLLWPIPNTAHTIKLADTLDYARLQPQDSAGHSERIWPHGGCIR